MKRSRNLKIDLSHVVRVRVNPSDYIDQISEISENLYLSSAFAAKNYDELHVRGITHILIIGIIGQQEIECAFPDKFVYKNIALHDNETENICAYFSDLIDWMSDVLANQNHKILVHCAKGISRSPTVVIAYLMYSRHLSYDDAYAFVQSRRPCIYPNTGFVCQLMDYGKVISDTESYTSSDSNESFDALDID